MEGFRHITPVTVRFRDIDVMGHVNNSVFFTYLEMARVEYMRDVVFQTRSRNLSEAGLILARISCDFKKPIFYGQAVEVGTRVAEMRNSSFLMAQRIEADGQLAALAEAVVVCYDYQAGMSVRIPDEFRARVKDFEGQGGLP
ncbi:MAG: thioesterase family protein [Anaerolineae bacterium]